MVEYIITYLIHHKQVPLPGIGTLEITYYPATYQFSDQIISAPRQEYRLNPKVDTKSLLYFQSFLTQINPDLVLQWERFVEQYELEMFSSSVHWPGIGSFIKKNGIVSYTSDLESQTYFSDIKASPIIRSNTNMTIMVGEHERSKEEMESFLSKDSTKRPIWLYILIAIILILGIGTAVWLYYFPRK